MAERIYNIVIQDPGTGEKSTPLLYNDKKATYNVARALLENSEHHMVGGTCFNLKIQTIRMRGIGEEVSTVNVLTKVGLDLWLNQS